MTTRADNTKGKLVLLLLLGGLLPWGVTIPPTADAQSNRPSPADCDAYARNYARHSGPSTLGGAFGGAGRGALFDAIGGSARKGANYDCAYNDRI